ncbi:hypothetical protein [Achromobacter dolens]|uniref:hypothetical protein n=1 Tax=Achromobacter dolens TaxID=1287738 RepID=UPI0012E0FC98|nr:hypothetical protein [Achromobacter dolens]
MAAKSSSFAPWFSTHRLFNQTVFDPAAHQSPGAALQENLQELETFQELKPAATLNLHRCSKT